ncbi:hypothetical protein SAMN05720761_10558 [Fibrobacter sp. UWCM]|uniref:hypothetical protein n=1 Tax=Fibrobacter sp. UWCM TaxID=1896208 RepID=UPI000920A291|nr:hypothetical protein [Fibrobacter sp. UWCM]SHG79733.1 hypothetical protein SAMN05720761_10558 [Fibrobacter sp. UWCM]
MKGNKINKSPEDILKDPRYKPFVGNNYQNGVKSKKGELKILFLGDRNNCWDEYNGNGQKKSYCEYLMTGTDKKCKDIQKKIVSKIKQELKEQSNLVVRISIKNIAFYNLRIANDNNTLITKELNFELYCDVLLKRIEKLKPNMVFGEQNLVTQLKSRAVSKWKEIESVLKPKYQKDPIIPVPFNDNRLERINSNGHGIDKLDFIHFIIDNDIDFLRRHCISPSLKKQSKNMLKDYRELDKKSSLTDSDFNFLNNTNSIEVPREEFIKACYCIHDIRNMLKEFHTELEYMQKNSGKKISSEYEMKNKVKQLIKTLTFLEKTDQYIYIGLVPQFMEYIDKKIPFDTEEEWDKEKNNLAIDFLDKNENQKNGSGAVTLLKNIGERLEKEGDLVSLERMRRIFIRPKIQKIYKSEEIDKLKLQIQSYNPQLK